MIHAQISNLKANTVGNILLTLGKYFCQERRDANMAKEYLEKALEIPSQDKKSQGEILSCLDYILLQYQYEKARVFCKHRKTCCNKQDIAMADSQYILGHIAYRENNLDEAFNLYMQFQSMIEHLKYEAKRYCFRRGAVLHSLGTIHTTVNHPIL